MKKTIAILVALCLCVGLCACGSSEEKESTPTTEPLQYEDTLIDQLKMSDPLSKAEEVFGAPTFSEQYPYEPFSMHYKYNDVTIYGLSFTPNVYTGKDGEVLAYAYEYYSKIHSAAYEEAYDKVLNNYIRILGEPDENDRANIWYLEDGTQLNINNLVVFTNTYRICIQLKKVTQ